VYGNCTRLPLEPDEVVRLEVDDRNLWPRQEGHTLCYIYINGCLRWVPDEAFGNQPCQPSEKKAEKLGLRLRNERFACAGAIVGSRRGIAEFFGDLYFASFQTKEYNTRAYSKIKSKNGELKEALPLPALHENLIGLIQSLQRFSAHCRVTGEWA